MQEKLISDVKKFMDAAECTTDSFNVRQIALYIGLQLEELAEKLEAVFTDASSEQVSTFINAMEAHATMFKTGEFDDYVRRGNREEMLDADVDLAWVTIGSAYSQGADFIGAANEVARANLAKIWPDGTMHRDTNGKVIKPEGWTAPDNKPYVCK